MMDKKDIVFLVLAALSMSSVAFGMEKNNGIDRKKDIRQEIVFWQVKVAITDVNIKRLEEEFGKAKKERYILKLIETNDNLLCLKKEQADNIKFLEAANLKLKKSLNEKEIEREEEIERRKETEREKEIERRRQQEMMEKKLRQLVRLAKETPVEETEEEPE